MNTKILIVEDEENISKIEQKYLERSGYDVVTAYDGKKALELFDEAKPQLIVLDLMIPKISGEVVLSKIREKSEVPVIVVSAKSDESDKINNLRSGADDYMTKPFSARELVERVKAVLRRFPVNEESSKSISTNDGVLEVYADSMRILKNGKDIHFTKNEFMILYTLFSHPTKIFTRDEIIEAAFGMDYDSFDRAIDTHIKNIRQKIEDDPRNSKYIKTIYGMGYRAGGFDEAEA